MVDNSVILNTLIAMFVSLLALYAGRLPGEYRKLWKMAEGEIKNPPKSPRPQDERRAEVRATGPALLVAVMALWGGAFATGRFPSMVFPTLGDQGNAALIVYIISGHLITFSVSCSLLARIDLQTDPDQGQRYIIYLNAFGWAALYLFIAICLVFPIILTRSSGT